MPARQHIARDTEADRLGARDRLVWPYLQPEDHQALQTRALEAVARLVSVTPEQKLFLPFIPDSDPLPTAEEIQAVLRARLEKMPERHQQIILLYHGANMATKEIAGILQVRVARIDYIRRLAEKRMRTALLRSMKQPEQHEDDAPRHRPESPTLKAHQALAPVYQQIGGVEALRSAGLARGEIRALRLRIVEGREFDQIAMATGAEEDTTRRLVNGAVVKLKTLAREKGLLPSVARGTYNITGSRRDHAILTQFFTTTGDEALLRANFAQGQIDDLRRLLVEGKPWKEIEAERAKEGGRARQSIRNSVHQLQVYACAHRTELGQIAAGIRLETSVRELES